MKAKQEKKQKSVTPASKKGRKKRPASRARASAITDPKNEYEVEEIMDYVDNGRAGSKYLIKWIGWPHRDNTWEPSSNLVNCSEELVKFYESRKAIVEKQKEKGEETWDVPPNPRG